MREQITALLEQRAAHIQRMRDLVVAAETEERDLTAEEAQEYDKIEKDADNLEERARRMEKLAGLAPQPERQIRDTNGDDGGQADAPDWMDDELRSGWNGKVPTDWAGFQELRRGTRPEDEPDYATVFFRWLTIPDVRNMTPGEFRVLSKASAGAGLNTVPTSFQRELIVALRDYGVMRQISRVITTDSGEDLQWPTVTAHGTASWTAENAAFSASDETFGMATLKAYKAATLMKVSEELLQDSAFDLPAYIRGEFGLRIGVLENTGYVAGDGSGKPTGVATQATAGVTAAGATAITANELIDLFHSLLPPYRRNASWLLKDSTIKLVRKLVDNSGGAGVGNYLWQPGLQAGAPDTLLGRPVYADPDMAAATTGLVSALFGDFNYYVIRDVDGVQFQRLNELYAENGQVGFRAYHRTDGYLMNTAAIKKLTQA
jgi:HK97 family phage major capsid protein